MTYTFNKKCFLFPIFSAFAQLVFAAFERQTSMTVLVRTINLTKLRRERKLSLALNLFLIKRLALERLIKDGKKISETRLLLYKVEG